MPKEVIYTTIIATYIVGLVVAEASRWNAGAMVVWPIIVLRKAIWSALTGKTSKE